MKTRKIPSIAQKYLNFSYFSLTKFQNLRSNTLHLKALTSTRQLKFSQPSWPQAPPPVDTKTALKTSRNETSFAYSQFYWRHSTAWLATRASCNVRILNTVHCAYQGHFDITVVSMWFDYSGYFRLGFMFEFTQILAFKGMWHNVTSYSLRVKIYLGWEHCPFKSLYHGQ